MREQPTMGPGSEESSPGYAGWSVTLAASGCVFVSFASLLVYTFGVLLKPVTSEFGWSRQSASVAFGVAAMAVAACSPFIGMLLDRYPARRVILPSIAVFGMAFASLSLLTPHLWHLYAVFLVLGIVGNGTAQLAYSRTLTTWFTARRGTAFALLMAGGAVGAMVWPPVAEALIRSTDWRHTVLILGGLVWVVGLPLGSTVRDRRCMLTENRAAPEGVSVGAALRSRAFWITVIVLFCASISQNATLTHLPAMLNDRGIPTSGAALAASAMGAAILIGRLFAGWLLDRFFAPRVATALLVVAALGAFLLAHAATAMWGLLGASLIGFGMGGEGDVTPYLLVRYFGVRSFSTLYGLTWTAYAIAGAIGPVIMGRAFDATGSYSALLIQLSTLTLGAAALMFLLPRYRTAADTALPAAEALPEVSF